MPAAKKNSMVNSRNSKTDAGDKKRSTKSRSNAASSPSGRQRMTPSQMERDPAVQCRRTVKREYVNECLKKNEDCELIKQCGQFGVGKENWPLNVDRIPEDKFRLFFEKTLADGTVVRNDEGISMWRQGRTCIRDVLNVMEGYIQSLDNCKASNTSNGKRNQSKSNSKMNAVRGTKSNQSKSNSKRNAGI